MTTANIPHDLTAGYRALIAARPEYATACAFYEGTVGDSPSSPQVAKLLAKYGLLDIADFNFAHIPVDVVANKLQVKQITTKDKSVNLLVDELRTENQLREELPILLRNACMYGDAYMMVWPTTDADGTVTSVSIRSKDPLTTRVFYDSEDTLKKSYAIQSWSEGTEKDRSYVVRANLYYADRIERYEHKGAVPQDSSKAKWSPFDSDGFASALDNPFGEVPFFHYRTDRTYGVPIHKNAFGPQTLINKLITSHAATIDYQSFPQRYALADPTADRSGSQSNDFDEEHPVDGYDPETSAQSQLDASPAAMWDLTGYKAVGQFNAADPDVFLKPLDRFIDAMAQVTEIPMNNYKPGGDQRMSGESRRVANEPLYARVERLQDEFGGALSQAMEFALNIMGEDVRVAIKWKPIRSIEDLAGLQALLIKNQLGVPRNVLLEEIGYDSDLADLWSSNATPEASGLAA